MATGATLAVARWALHELGRTGWHDMHLHARVLGDPDAGPGPSGAGA